ncbi:MAG: hypothetical protein K0S41_113 [Anaerocolumna sp.]|jgi:hypothetical protein|nr:hypothetical protein [Anaerocolumna sp.]
MDKNQNPSIGCVVTECKYHAQNADYCTLDKIMVGKNESFSSKSEDTDCESFIVRDSYK